MVTATDSVRYVIAENTHILVGSGNQKGFLTEVVSCLKHNQVTRKTN